MCPAGPCHGGAQFVRRLAGLSACPSFLPICVFKTYQRRISGRWPPSLLCSSLWELSCLPAQELREAHWPACHASTSQPDVHVQGEVTPRGGGAGPNATQLGEAGPWLGEHRWKLHGDRHLTQGSPHAGLVTGCDAGEGFGNRDKGNEPLSSSHFSVIKPVDFEARKAWV